MNPNKRLRLAQEKSEAGSHAFEAGHYSQAADLYLEAAELWKGLKGQEHNYARCLGYAGQALSKSGHYAQAKDSLEKALRLQKKILGFEHSDVATSLDGLASVHYTQGKYEQAKQLYEKALVIKKKILGDEHSDVATSLDGLASVHYTQGNYEQAKQLYEKALVIKKKILGDEHPDVANSLNNLARVYSMQGDFEKAKDLYQRAQTIIKKIFDENHPTAKTISENYLELSTQVEQLKRREIEQRLALEEAKRLSYLGNMATGVAHNINNPVGIIRLAAQRGLRKLEKGLSVEEGQKIFQRILTQADRLHTIIENFRKFAQGDRQHREEVALNVLVEQTQDYFKSQFEAHRIALKIELSDNNPCSQANYFVLQEVLINLIHNAREALEHIPDAYLLIKTWQEEKKVGVQVEDNGPGIPPEQQKHLFSPFHSTKAHGTGLGLHFAYQALIELGGTLTYQDRTPHGACFRIELPPTHGALV